MTDSVTYTTHEKENLSRHKYIIKCSKFPDIYHFVLLNSSNIDFYKPLIFTLFSSMI